MITQQRAISNKSGWQQRSRQRMQQPTINGSGKGWWRLATRARGQQLAIGDEREPLLSCDDAPYDGAPPAGKRGIQRQRLFCHCRQPVADVATRGGQEATAKREKEGQEDNNNAAIAANGGQAARREATTNQRR